MIWTYLSLLCMLGTHDFHISKCEINFDLEDEALEVVLHIYTDDLELGIEQQTGTNPKFYSAVETANADELLIKYLSDKFALRSGDTQLYWTYIGREMTEDLSASLVYLEVSGVKNVSTLEITNSILMETFDDQRNMLQCREAGKVSAFYMMAGEDTKYDWILRSKIGVGTE